MFKNKIYRYCKATLCEDLPKFLGNILFREIPCYVGSGPACYGSSLGSNPDNSLKNKMGDFSKEVANTL